MAVCVTMMGLLVSSVLSLFLSFFFSTKAVLDVCLISLYPFSFIVFKLCQFQLALNLSVSHCDVIMKQPSYYNHHVNVFKSEADEMWWTFGNTNKKMYSCFGKYNLKTATDLCQTLQVIYFLAFLPLLLGAVIAASENPAFTLSKVCN